MLTPNGNRKYMQAQDESLMDKFAFWGDIPTRVVGEPEGDDPFEAAAEDAHPVDEAPVEQAPEAPVTEEPVAEDTLGEDDEASMTEFLYNKLVGWGFPERRLQEFTDKFIAEKWSSHDVKDITITLPDYYYGGTRRIKDSEIKSLIAAIQEQFGLSFIDLDRNDRKLVMQFSSQAEPSPEEQAEFDAAMGDGLEGVYGSPAKKGKNKSASRYNDMTKATRGSVLDWVLKNSEG